MGKKVLFLLIVLIIINTVIVNAESLDGYSLVGDVEDVVLQGQKNKWLVDISLYKSDTMSPQFVYSLENNKRGICVGKTINNKFENIVWGIEDDCSEPDAVDALYYLEYVYDYYHNVLGWDSSDKTGKPLEVYVATGSVNQNNLTAGLYVKNNNTIWIKTAQRSDNTTYTASGQVMAHEFTHGVLYWHGISNADKDSDADEDTKEIIESIDDLTEAAIHEGYADVMAICIFPNRNNWIYAEDFGGIFGTKRDLKKPRYKELERYEDYYDGFGKVDIFKEVHDEHSLGEIIGYTAYLMNQGDHSTQALDYDQIAKLFFESMSYLPTYPSFSHVGTALRLAAEQLSHTMNIQGVPFISDSQEKRVKWALSETGIGSSNLYLDLNEPGITINVLDVNKKPYGDYKAEIFLSDYFVPLVNFDSLEPAWRGEGSINGLYIPFQTWDGLAYLVLTDMKNPERRIVYRLDLVHDNVIRESLTKLNIIDEEEYYNKTIQTPFGDSYEDDTALIEIETIVIGEDKQEQVDDEDIPKHSLFGYVEEIAYLYPVMPEYEWWGKQGVNANGWQVWSPDWQTTDLNGLLTADIQDYDSDGQDELLAVLFNVEGDILHEQLLMFEDIDGNIQLKAIHDIPVETNLFYDELYSGFRISTFTYDNSSRQLIAANYDDYREGGGSVLALYSYDGQQFVYEQGFMISKGSDDSVWCSKTSYEPEMPLSWMAVSPWESFAQTDDEILYGGEYEYMGEEYRNYIRSVEQEYESALAEYGLKWNRFNGTITDLEGIKAVNILNKAPMNELFSGIEPLCDINLYLKFWEQEGDDDYPEAILYTMDYTDLLAPYRE